jgi:hypothetical protein
MNCGEIIGHLKRINQKKIIGVPVIETDKPGDMNTII